MSRKENKEGSSPQEKKPEEHSFEARDGHTLEA
jgi:hypothetical protein